jgi:hypothetical protein
VASSTPSTVSQACMACPVSASGRPEAKPSTVDDERGARRRPQPARAEGSGAGERRRDAMRRVQPWRGLWRGVQAGSRRGMPRGATSLGGGPGPARPPTAGLEAPRIGRPRPHEPHRRRPPSRGLHPVRRHQPHSRGARPRGARVRALRRGRCGPGRAGGAHRRELRRGRGPHGAAGGGGLLGAVVRPAPHDWPRPSRRPPRSCGGANWLAKVNSDDNPQVARFGIRSIPDARAAWKAGQGGAATKPARCRPGRSWPLAVGRALGIRGAGPAGPAAPGSRGLRLTSPGRLGPARVALGQRASVVAVLCSVRSPSATSASRTSPPCPRRR